MSVYITLNSKTKKNQCIGELLAQGYSRLKGNGNCRARQESQLLLSYLLGKERADLFLNTDLTVSSREVSRFDKWINQRNYGIPIQLITGVMNFMGMEFKVTKGVFIPRPETEILVDQVIQLIHSLPQKREYRFLDIGVGSGVIPIAICDYFKKSSKKIYFYAIDISKKAIKLAKENAKRFHCMDKIEFLQGNLFRPLQDLNQTISFDGIISNPPYISYDEWNHLPNEVTSYEPHRSLYGGEDGLDFYRRIIEQSPGYLKRENGFLALEIGHNQKNSISRLIAQNCYFKKEIITFYDYNQHDRGIIALTGT